MTSRLLFLLVLIAASTAVAQPEEYPTPPEAVEHADVPKGRIDGPHEFRRQLFPGTIREYWVYVPAKYDATKPPCLMVAHDGKAKDWNLPTVLDNMIHSGDIPVQLGIFVMPGVVPVTTIQHRHVSTVASNTTAWATSTPDF